jgi:preprotein translocase subunit SecE
MSSQQQIQTDKTSFDWLKWILVVLIIAAVAVLNSIYSAESLFYRVLGGLVLAIIALMIALQTLQGKEFWRMAKGSRTEVRRVVWPTKQERNRATLMVVAMIFVMALILWGLDSFFGWLASRLLG